MLCLPFCCDRPQKCTVAKGNPKPLTSFAVHALVDRRIAVAMGKEATVHTLAVSNVEQSAEEQAEHQRVEHVEGRLETKIFRRLKAF